MTGRYAIHWRIARLKDEEKLGASEIAQRLGIGRASVYRVLNETVG
jgi:DNA-binding transcriptional regulator LsrR (DeoR family)